MSLLSPDIYGTAFAHWRRVQQQLSQTIQDYVDACAALGTTLAVFPEDDSSRCQQAQVFADLDSQLPFLASHEKSLHDARFSLKTIRNHSQRLILTNSLPPEILDAIFLLVVEQDANAVCALTGVCKLWRHMTLQSPACWSRIALPIGPDDDPAYDRALLWGERARNEPLHISVWERPHRVEEFVYTDDDIGIAVDRLASLMPRVCAMSFAADGCPLDKLVPMLLACWVEHGFIGTAKILEVNAKRLDAVDLRATSSLLANPSLKKFETFFRSLHTLSLWNATYDWRFGSGLVDLYLDQPSRHRPYSECEIAAMLAQNPRLRSLSLIGVEIRIHRDHEGTPSAVALNELDVLRLESRTRNLWAVLQMITSTSNSIRTSLSFTNHPEFIPVARSFFERCRVTALYICPRSYNASPRISSLFTSMPHLKLLAIHNCSIFEETWQSPAHPDGSSLDLWPRLDEVYLTHCNLDKDLPRLVSIHVPRSVWAIECAQYGERETRSRVEDQLRRHAVKLVWVERRSDMHAQARAFSIGDFD